MRPHALVLMLLLTPRSVAAEGLPATEGGRAGSPDRQLAAMTDNSWLNLKPQGRAFRYR